MTWAAIPGFPGYEASSDGDVRSARGVLRPWSSRGYQVVSLRRDGRTVKAGVHRLVLAAFRGPAPAGTEACHNDGNRANNALGNLRWDTRAANIRDQVAHGTHNHASKTHCPAGHPYTPANTYRLRGGRRQCATCTRSRAAAAHHLRSAS